MSEGPAPGCPGGPRRWAVVLALLGLIGVAEAGRAWVAWRSELGPLGHLGATGSLCAVTLTNGQIYYGTLGEAVPGYLRLQNVYYVQNVKAGKDSADTFHLTNRRQNDWHGPTWMAIPTREIFYVENVGAHSRLASLIAQDEGKKAPAP